MKDAGTQKPQFAPHYVFAFFEASLLAGHGIYELLAEDMSDLGVIVIWCSEVAKLLPENLAHHLRRLSNLNHLEVEKNAVPEALSLFEQYQVKTVEDLGIAERWDRAEPNKSIASLIGWRSKADYVYWDLHERAHSPHALVGGTTGSGKSEFLTTQSAEL